MEGPVRDLLQNAFGQKLLGVVYDPTTHWVTLSFETVQWSIQARSGIADQERVEQRERPDNRALDGVHPHASLTREVRQC